MLSKIQKVDDERDLKRQRNLQRALKGWVTRRKNLANKALENNSPLNKFSKFPDKTLIQIYSTGLEYSFVSSKNEQCHPFALCKDFLQDMVWATINNKDVSLFGLSYKVKTNPTVDLKSLRMAFRLKKETGETTISYFKNTERFLKEVEKDLGFSTGTMKIILTETETLGIYEGDAKWIFSPVMVSLFSLLIRVGLTYKGTDWKNHLYEGEHFVGKNDKNYIKSCKGGIEEVLSKPLTEIFASTMEGNYPSTNMDMYSLHNYTGIQAFSTKKYYKAAAINWPNKEDKK